MKKSPKINIKTTSYNQLMFLQKYIFYHKNSKFLGVDCDKNVAHFLDFDLR